MASTYLALAIFFNAAANSLFKFTSAIPEFSVRKGGFLSLALLIGLANTLCFIKSLEKIDLSTSYPIFSGGSIILISLISAILFRETFSAQKLIGVLVLCGGMYLIWRV